MGGRTVLLQQIDTLFHAGALGHLPDAELLRRFVTGGGGDAERSFEALVERHGPMVLGACRRLLRDPADAQDAFQATFLVLARKADRIGRPERLASWLYGVASRTAMKARTTNARRRRHERVRAESVAEGQRPAEDAWELRAALHEEIARLPEKYRAPVVLCHLEGMSRERASAHLRCPEGTVGVRLMRARERLRAGLARRGFAVAAGGLIFDLGADSAPASVPGGLAGATARAGVAFAEDAHTAGMVPARVFQLSRGVLTSMRWHRLTMGASAFLLAAFLAAGAATSAWVRGPEPNSADARERVDDAPRWRKTLPGGETIELIGVSPEQGESKTWWEPGGSPLPEPAFDHLGGTLGPREGHKLRVFAIGISGPRGISDVGIVWKFAESNSVVSGSPNWTGKARPKPGVFGAVASFPVEAKAGTVRIGVAAGPWTTRATSAFGSGMSSVGRDGGSVAFARARAMKEGVSLCLTDTYVNDDTRTVAVDREGKEHTAASAGWTGQGDPRSFRLHDLTFGLDPDRVREFRFQTRPYEWAEFPDVSLEPAPAPPKP